MRINHWVGVMVLAGWLAAATVGGGAPAAATRPGIEEKSQRLLEGWKERFEAEGFHAVAAGPFVIAGDGSRARVEGWRDRTVMAAARALGAQFFAKAPEEPVLILLFETGESYRRLGKKWFGYQDVPHFGFFRHDNIMLMNISTGGGTLVHELTHALMRPDFPQAPRWFCEGLASLYEQCSLGEDTITGHENWRLAGLQKAMRAGAVRPLKEMMEDGEFDNKERVGLNYAQARYLAFYLQERGLLRAYYQQFRDGAKDDPTGVKTLEKVVAPKSLEEFDKDWRAWVMTLKFE